ncbi:MAG: SUMF1/EgtB/PvdO family nonheme iron enzyme [Bacteroidia bacterium]
MTKPLIFLNYRKNAAQGHATTIRLLLENTFGKDAVFQDYHSIQSGEDWAATIPQAIREAKVFLAFIHGDEWLELGEYKTDRRLFREDDWVRKEIQIALDENKIIIPILLQGIKKWPAEKNIAEVSPEGLEPFFRLQGEWFNPDKPEIAIQALQSRLNGVMSPQPQSGEVPLFPLNDFPLNANLIRELCYLDSPYIGIPHFDEAHAPLFFGRDEDIWRLYYEYITQLAPGQILLLHGASGVGKSSLLNAGIFPRLKYKGWNVSYDRRKKQTGADQSPAGLHILLGNLIAKADEGEKTERIILLDQVEEMLTDRGADDEKPAFFEMLKRAPDTVKIVLGFRKEYLADIKDQLKDYRINYLEYSLRPLGKESVRRAIRGVFDTPEVKKMFPRLGTLDPLLEAALIRDITQDEVSHIAPLLQFQLENLYKAAERAAHGGVIYLKLDQYQPETSLQSYLENHKLAAVEKTFPEAAASGLINDILYFYTTPDLTAATQAGGDYVARYAHIEARWPGRLKEIQQCLADQYLLLRQDEAHTSRLAHDALARIVRKRYETSSLPGQQAAFIIRAKEKIAIQKVQFSETDITLIETGQWGMSAVPPEIQQRIQTDKQRYLTQKYDRQRLALRSAAEDIEHLRFVQALDNLHIAWQEGIRPERILALARHLPYPFEQLGLEEKREECMALMAEMNRYISANWNIPHIDTSIIHTDRFFPSLVEVKGGRYKMGSTEGARYYKQEGPEHMVEVDGFWMGATPVTCWQFGMYCLDTGRELPRDSGFGRGDRPVVNVNWYETTHYCNWLSLRQGLEPVYEHPDGQTVIALWENNGYRLPTEAEWEYAARERGKNIRFGNGKDIADPSEINFDGQHVYNTFDKTIASWIQKGENRGATTPVRRFSPNALGLYDMSGNVYEWCWDGYDENFYQNSPEKNPRGPEKKQTDQVVRGGSWFETALDCRCSYRNGDIPFDLNNVIGFRVVRR